MKFIRKMDKKGEKSKTLTVLHIQPDKLMHGIQRI